VNDPAIDRIVDAVSDGEQIDWTSARRRLNSRAALESCTHLETLAKIGGLAADLNRTHTEAREPFWVSLILAIAFLHIGLGLVGSIGYRDYTFFNVLRLLVVLSFTGVGIVLRATRDNARARDLGTAFVLIGMGFSRNPYRALFDALVGDVPAMHGLRTGLAVDTWAPFFMWQFARRFPATLRFTTTDRLAMVFARVALVAGTVLFAVNLWTAATRPAAGFLRTFAFEYEEGQRFSSTIFVLTLPALVTILLRARGAAGDERARVRLFSWAMVGGYVPIYVETILEALLPRYTAFLRGSPQALTVMIVTVLLLLLVIPIVTGYSVLVHRMLDVRVVVRTGIRYLLAKWTLLGLTLLPFGLLASHVYTQRNDSVADVFSGPRSVILLSLVVLGGGLFLGKAHLVQVLDRWFDRRGADRTAVLAQSSTALRMVRARSELVACVNEAAESALNASAAIYFFEAGRHAYVSATRGGLSLSANSALATVMMQEPSLSVIAANGDQSIARFLPEAERLWLAEANGDVLAPIRATGVERPVGLIAFAARRDAIGYSRDDERFVAALASAAGIALENLRLKAEAVGEDEGDFGMLCVRCRRVVDSDGETTCPCGGVLQTAAVPRRINAKFLVEGLLGTGGMGVAYLARDIGLERWVAIKTLPSISADAMAGLAREARVMAGLSHPNLATILGYEWWRGTPILVCEYLPGGTLQQRLASGSLSVDEGVSLGLTLLDALAYMHAEGVLHRDIKPSNIAFSRDRTVKLLDFGLAGLLERIQSSPTTPGEGATMLTRPAGTLAYLPPAFFTGAAPDVQFDLWAVAVVLFEALVGRHPFAAGVATVENICRARFVSDDDCLPASLTSFLREALRAGASPRFDSAVAMRDALAATRAAIHAEGHAHATDH
jgi:GAF domain-containing protein